MKKTRLRTIIIVVVLVTIAYFLVPLTLQSMKSPLADQLATSKLPWDYLLKSGDDDTDYTMRLWTNKLLKLGLDLQGGMQIDLAVDFSETEIPEDQHEEAVQAALEIIRNRIDQFGVAEPILTRSPGKNRIILQLPGVQNFDRTKDLIKKTALLEFKLVAEDEQIKQVYDRLDKEIEMGYDEHYSVQYPALAKFAEVVEDIETPIEFDEEDSTATEEDTTVAEEETEVVEINKKHLFSQVSSYAGYPMMVEEKNIVLLQELLNDEKLQRAIPAGLEVLIGKQNKKQPSQPRPLYVVVDKAEVTGQYLADARVAIGQGDDPREANRAYVALEFNREGSRRFARVTGQNINRRLAIVLDNTVFMAPTIQDKIFGEGRITGLADEEEAQDLVIVLKAGNLPAPVTIIQERSVGPTLGSDSIKAGFLSAVIGLIVVALFMAVYYKLSGLIADLALIVNIGFILAALTMLEATLTLPGIAGMILTIGMAVDANVLIFERIREELRTGKTARSAIDSGFSRAIVTILDANITTLITAIVLYQFGTGPIRGFAVTLSIGIIGSMFASIILVRAIFDGMIGNKPRKSLSI